MTQIHKLLQSANVPIGKVSGHRLNRLTLPIHHETSNVLLSKLPVLAVHEHGYIWQESLQLQLESFDLSSCQA